MKSDAELKDILRTLEDIDKRKTYSALLYFEPYDKQKQFFALGANKQERLLTAGNQQGKSHAGAFEGACHLTGIYPRWWTGKRFTKPTRGWACGESAEATRSIIQRKLCGEPGVASQFGTGLIPKDLFADKPSLARGVTDAYDMIQVKHKSGGVSILKFKSYPQGREMFQGETLDFIWNDEEPPMEIYSEELARLTVTKGIIFTTFTSMKGDTALTDRFFKDRPEAMVQMGLADAKHIPQEDWEEHIAKFLPHERIARIYGGIMRGEGRVFLTPEETIAEPLIERVPGHWFKIWGIDFGIGHPFAAALLLWDKDNDIIHLHHIVRIKDAISLVHADHMKRIAGNVPVAWPRDGTDRDAHSGEPIAAGYRKHGLKMLSDHATWPEGVVSTYAGIKEMDERFKSGKLLVAQHLGEFFEEYRQYHYDKGKIVKLNDDILSAVRIGIMMKRFAQMVPLGRPPSRLATTQMARNVDFDVFE